MEPQDKVDKTQTEGPRLSPRLRDAETIRLSREELQSMATGGPMEALSAEDAATLAGFRAQTGGQGTLAIGPAHPAEGSHSGDTQPPILGQDSLERAECLAERYELLGLLGTGAMGTVYRARDLELDELVALKVLRKDLVGNPAVLSRFRQEVKLARRVTHRHVARVYDIGEHRGERFLTMELIDGETLGSKVTRDAPLTVIETAALGMALCEGLEAAHTAGVVHRDLKPDNVILSRDGRPVITDFGIARALVEEDATGEGALVGTPAYMAPEQVEGARRLDGRTDLYALGAILFELLTGKPAWNRDNPLATTLARLSEPPPDPRAIRPDLHPAVAQTVVTCLARAPEERFQNASELAQALSRWSGLESWSSGAGGETRSLSVRRSLPAMGERRIKKVAVLPTYNLGPSGDDYLAEGFAQDLVAGLSSLGELQVSVPPGRKLASGQSPRDTGQSLGVQAVVESSLRRHGDMLRTALRVIGVADGFQLWAGRFDRKPAEVLHLAEEAARAIAAAMTVRSGTPSRSGPTDPVAVDLLLRARHAYHRYWDQASNRALELFEQAWQLAPDDPAILSGYAMALVRHLAFDNRPIASGGGQDRTSLPRTLAERAVALAPQRPEPHMALSALAGAKGDMPQLARSARRALLASPSHAEANDVVGQLLVEVGRAREGIARLSLVINLEGPLINTVPALARAHALLGEWEKVDEIMAWPVYHAEHINGIWVHRARFALWRRDRPRLKAIMQEIESEQFFLKPQTVGLCRTGLEGQPTQEYLAFLEGASRSRPSMRMKVFFHQLTSEVFAFAGLTEDLFVELRAACHAGLVDLLWLEQCPLLKPYAGLEPFRQVHREVQARAAATLSALDQDG